MARLRSLNEELNAQNTQQEGLLRDKITECQNLDRSVNGFREELYVEQNRSLKERNFQMEIAHMRMDMKRMVELITSTKEFEAFKYYSESGAAASFLPPDLELALTQGPLSEQDKESLMAWGRSVTEFAREFSVPMTTRPPISFSDEEKHWIPRDALLLATHFKAKHLLSLPIEIIHDFLRQLNLIWQKREKWRATKLKDEYKDKITTLERQVRNKIPYDGVIQQKEIARLKKDILHLYRQLHRRSISAAKAKHSNSVDSIGTPIDWNNLDSSFLARSMVTAEDMSRQLQESTQRIGELEATVRQYETDREFLRQAEFTEKKRALESSNEATDQAHWFTTGASWLGDKMFRITNDFMAQMNDLLNDIRRRAHAIPNDVDKRSKLMALLLQLDAGVRELSHAYKEKLTTTRQTAASTT